MTGAGALIHVYQGQRQSLTIYLPVCARFQPTWARIISGVQEGVYGWVALNYQEGHLQRAAAAPGSIRAADQTLAALDLGGSSLEVRA